MTKSYIAPDLPQSTPYLIVKDPIQSINFYEKAFGFKPFEQDTMKDEDGKILHVHMAMEDAHIMFCPEGAWGSPKKTPKNTNTMPAMNMYIYCSDVDSLHAQAVNSGAQSLAPPEDMPWGDRMCVLCDPDGHEWAFATHKGQPS